MGDKIWYRVPPRPMKPKHYSLVSLTLLTAIKRRFYKDELPLPVRGIGNAVRIEADPSHMAWLEGVVDAAYDAQTQAEAKELLRVLSLEGVIEVWIDD
jgi:hypothetical protein